MCSRSHLLQPLRCAVVGHGLIKAHPVVPLKIFHAVGLAAPRNVFRAGIDRPQRVTHLAPDERIVLGVTRAQGNVHFPFCKVEVLVTHHEFHLQTGIAGAEPVQQR